jgi:hypothetical protein
LRCFLSLPDIRKELVDVLCWRRANLGQDADEVPLRIDAVAFGAGDERPEPSVVLGRRVVAREQPMRK